MKPLSPADGGKGLGIEGNVFFHPSPHGLWYQPAWILKKGKELSADHPIDVMTVHEYPPFYNGMGARRLSRQTGIPIVLEIHHVVGYPVAGSFAERIGVAMSRFLLPPACRRAAAVRVVNRATKDLLVSFGASGENIRVVPSFYLDASLAALPLIGKRYDLVFAARLAANKGLLSLLDAVRLLPGCTLAVVGEGLMLARAKERAQALGIVGRVSFLGWLPTQDEVMKVLRQGKVFVMNSTSEGGPRSALEAMACGLPVVSTRVGAMPDVIENGKNGMFTSGTPEDLARILQPLLADEALRARIGAEARKILQRFERTTLVREYAEFLKSVVLP
jgi:glycosyltransferase involved in cell wall biosynthesis